MNMNSKMTVTFQLTRTGFFFLPYSSLVDYLHKSALFLFFMGFFLFCCQPFNYSCDYHIVIAIAIGLSVSVNMTKGQI